MLRGIVSEWMITLNRRQSMIAMGRTYLLFLLPIISLSAQTEYEYQYEDLYLPRDASGNIVYTDAVAVPGVSGDEIFTNARHWLYNNFKFFRERIQYEDPESGVIGGGGIMMVRNRFLWYLFETPVLFSLRIETKDEEFRYFISDLVIVHADPRFMDQPIEQAFSQENLYKTSGKPRKRLFYFYWMFDEMIVGLEHRIKFELPPPPLGLGEDW